MTMSQSSQRSGGNSSQGSSQQSQHLLVAHSDKISILSAKDNFSKRHTFRISSSIPGPSFVRVPDGQALTPGAPPSALPTQTTSNLHFFQPGVEPRLTPHTASSVVHTYNDAYGSRVLPSTIEKDGQPLEPRISTPAIRINQMEYNPLDSCLYLALQSTGLGSGSAGGVVKTINTISVWSLDLSLI